MAAEELPAASMLARQDVVSWTVTGHARRRGLAADRQQPSSCSTCQAAGTSNQLLHFVSACKVNVSDKAVHAGLAPSLCQLTNICLALLLKDDMAR